jgi:hypothetical protein
MPKLAKKTVEDTKWIIRMRLFLNECGLGKLKLSAGELGKLVKILCPSAAYFLIPQK